MMIALHKNARTTPAIRAEIAASSASAASLAQRFGITLATVYKWKNRSSGLDVGAAVWGMVMGLGGCNKVAL